MLSFEKACPLAGPALGRVTHTTDREMEYIGYLCFIIDIQCSCYTYSTYGTVSTDLTTVLPEELASK